ncbi:MAG TPA: Crp/Fnr family transcriptional regulator [Anaerolineales bacterium]|jgi:CRP/FNR family transcriptional regulator|nr:Crp/Fnr family transcriptional regulator [Anaerolineales bacterium]
MITKTQFDELVKHYPVLAALPPYQKRIIHQDLVRFEAQQNEVLFDVGCPCPAAILLVSGIVRVSKPSSYGRDLLLYRLEPGDICALTVACLLGDKNYPGRGLSETASIGYALSEELFEQLLVGFPQFRHFVFRSFAQNLLQLMALLEEVAWGHLDRRLAAVLLAKGETVRATHHRLADDVGSVREVVSRILKEFESKGWVRLGRGRILITNKEDLQRFADEFGDSSH